MQRSRAASGVKRCLGECRWERDLINCSMGLGQKMLFGGSTSILKHLDIYGCVEVLGSVLLRKQSDEHGSIGCRHIHDTLVLGRQLQIRDSSINDFGIIPKPTTSVVIISAANQIISCCVTINYTDFRNNVSEAAKSFSKVFLKNFCVFLRIINWRYPVTVRDFRYREHYIILRQV